MIPVDLTRYEDRITEIEAHGVQEGKIILYGSSFFARWGYDRAKEQFEEASGGKLDVLNHGFGGATIDELLRFYPRLITPYKPRAVMIRSIFNEIHKGLSPEGSIFLVERLLSWLEVDYPGMPVLIIRVNDNRFCDAAEAARMNRANALLEAVAKDHPAVTVLDINSFFYDAEGNMRPVFVDDGLHLTDEAYQEMARYLADRILSCLNQ